MKGAKKHFSRALTLLLSVLIMLQTVTVPAFAAENATENVEVATNDASTEEESTFNLIKADVQIDDEYGNETDYISEVQIPDLEQISEETLVENGVSIHSDYPGDAMVYLTQRWLNQEYGNVPGFGYVTEDGRTGWDTVYGLTRALQVELGITDLADNFGPTTERLYSQNLLRRQDGVTNRKFAILQGALWCKGYNPGYNLSETEDGTVVFNGVFDADVEKAIIELKEDAGLINPNGVVTVNIMKALMSMDSFKLLSSYGGTEAVREMQQKLNRKYEAYTGITPCDGVYGRNTNRALIYALQAEEGMPTDVANANFGVTTRLCCPEIPYIRDSAAARRYPGTSSGNYYSAAQIASITELLQFALLVNGHSAGAIDGEYGDATRQALYDFQADMKIPQNGKADKTTWLSLFISCGDTSRSALAADCATQLTAAKAKSLYDNGYRYIGRYLTGNSKKITRSEAQIIFDAGLSFFPIYQTSADENSYFTSAQGTRDAKAAIAAAAELGIPQNTFIYFAVDYDCLDYQVTSNVIPYFKSVHEVMSNSIYRVGIYGTRNVCTRVSDKGYAERSFVGDMSTGFSGNLGFGMPSNWAFDQFYTTSIGSGSGYLEIDKDGFSGNDSGVSKLDEPKNVVEVPKITVNNGAAIDLEGPVVNIFGVDTSLFKMKLDWGLDLDDLIDYEYDVKEGTYKVTIGLKESERDPSLKTSNYAELKEMIQFFGGHTTTATWNKYQKLRSKLKKTKLDFGFEFDGSLSGYAEIDAQTGIVREGGLILVAETATSASAPMPLYPCTYFRFEINGSMEQKFFVELKEIGLYGLEGAGNYSVELKAGIAAGIEKIMMAYAGGSGTLNFEYKSLSNFSESTTISINLALFLEIETLLWGGTFDWEFKELQLYPKTEAAEALMTVSRDDLKFIEPLQGPVTCSTNPAVYKANVQKYCSPKIVELNSGKMLMAYIDDVSSRSDENRTALMYSIYDGTSWSAAKPIFDDGTMDYAPIMCADGNGGAHIVWQNAKKEFGTDVTLDEMSTNMELYYTHWDGEVFSGTVALTSNLDYETNYSLASNGTDVTVVWQQNSENDPFSAEGTNSIHRKQLVGGKWQSEETIASNLPIVNSIACSYIGNNSVVAYSAKTNTDMSSVDDMEVYYYGDGELSRVTENSTSDTSVYFMDDKLYWMGNHAIMCMTGGGAATVETVVDNLPESVSTFKVLKSANGQKAIVWEDVNEKAQFYGTYYNETLDKFGNILPLTTGDDVIRGWDACMMSTGKIQLAYCAADALSEPENGKAYGQLDLIQKEAEAFCDVSVNPTVTYSGEVTSGEAIVLSADVYNNGSADVSAFDIEIVDPQGNVVDSRTLNETLDIGGSANLEIPFTLPQTISRTNYAIRITPHGNTDVRPTDNEASFEIGLADIAIENVQESITDTGRQLQITVANKGYEKIDAAKLVVYSDSVQGEVLADINIAALDAGEEIVLSYDIAETSLGSDPLQPNLYHLVVETDADEANYGNNEKDVSVHAKCVISLSSGNGGTVRGTGSYSYGSTVTISAIPNEGYMFEGWYEDGRCLYNISDEYTFTAFTNRTIEAKFVPNDLTISNVEVIGDMEPETALVFSAKAEGGYQPYVWEYAIYKGDTLYYNLSDSTFDYLEWSPTEAGDYTIVVWVTDKTGFKATYSKQFSII